LTTPLLAELAALDNAGFRTRFAGTSLRRTGRDRFVRNVLIAIGNASRPTDELVESTRGRLGDASPLVRGAAVWAFARIATAGEVTAEAAARAPGETDPTVRAEWQRLDSSLAAAPC